MAGRLVEASVAGIPWPTRPSYSEVASLMGSKMDVVRSAEEDAKEEERSACRRLIQLVFSRKKKEDTTNVELFRQSLIQGLSANVWEKADVA